MYAMGSLWFESALLPSGWASRVRLTVRDGYIASITPEENTGSMNA